MRFRPEGFLKTATAAATAVLAGCSVDYAGILGGKTCDQSGACSEGYVCDRQTWSCVEGGGAAVPDAGRGDGGSAFSDAPAVDTAATDDRWEPAPDTGLDAAADASDLPDTSDLSDASDQPDSGADANGLDAGPSDTGATDTGIADAGPVDTGPDDTGLPDNGPADAGPDDSGPADAGFVDAGVMVCPPNSLKCVSGTDLQICKSDGSTWEWSQTCQGFCLTDHCVDCKPGNHRCADSSNVEFCRYDGSGWDWDEWCGGFCLDDHCVDCKPADKWCDWDDLLTCAPDGSPVSKNCQFGCNADLAECHVCEPDSDWCAGNVLQSCWADGMGSDKHDCCVPSSCREGACVDDSPWIANAAPLAADVYTDANITIDGCQFAGSAVVEFWFGSSWGQPGNGSITGRTGSTQIRYRLTNIQPPRNKDYPMRVHNPGGGSSNQVTFHVNN